MAMQLVSASLLSGCLAAASAVAVPRTLITVGFVDHGSVYAARAYLPSAADWSYCGDYEISVYQQPRGVPGRPPTKVQRFVFFQHLIESTYHWRIAQGHFWGSCDSIREWCSESSNVKPISLEELPLLDPDAVNGPERYSELHSYKNPDWYLGKLEALAEAIVRAECAKLAMPVFGPPPPRLHTPVKPIFFDVVPTGRRNLLLFVLQDGRIRVWRGKAGKPPAEQLNAEMGVRWSDLVGGPIAADFQGPFRVYVRGGHYYFLTESGRLYVSPKAHDPPPAATRLGVPYRRLYVSTKTGQRRQRAAPLWTDAKRPIRAVITDNASGKTFAFAPAKLGAKSGVYFELQAKLMPVPYRLKPVKGLKDAKPLRLVLEYVHALRAERRID